MGRPRTTPSWFPSRGTTAGGIDAGLSDGWFVLGAPGTGKTFFARRLVRELRTMYPGALLYILDSKGASDFDGWPNLIETEDPPSPLPGVEDDDFVGHTQVWRPPDDDPDAYGVWLRGILKARRPAVVLVDELSSLAEGSEDHPRYPMALTRMLKQGRALRIAPVVLTQEAAGIPRGVKNLTRHFVYFRLGHEDRYGIARACRLLGMPLAPKWTVPPEPRHRYGLFHRILQPAPGPTHEYRDAGDFFGHAA